MTPQSAKAKGRRLQQWVRDLLLRLAPALEAGDVESRSMGAAGADIMLSSAGRWHWPFTIECKHRASFAVYADYAQAKRHLDNNDWTGVPVLVIKQNHSRPLVVLDAEWFFTYYQRAKD